MGCGKSEGEIKGEGAGRRTFAELRAPNRIRHIAGPVRWRAYWSPCGACVATARALVPQSALDAVAASLANGVQLDPALASSGYRLTEVQVISLSGEGLSGQLAPLLAPQFCVQIGVYRSSNQVWIVLGAPFAPRVGLTGQMLAERMLALGRREHRVRSRLTRAGGLRLARES